MKKAINQRPFLFFLIFTFAISFGTGFPTMVVPGKFEGLLYFSDFRPAIGALIVVGIAEGSDGIRSLIRSLFQWRVNFVWYLVVLLGPALTMVTAVLLYNVLGKNGSVPNLNEWISILPQHLLVILSLFLFMMGVFGERKSAGADLPCRNYKKKFTRCGQVWFWGQSGQSGTCPCSLLKTLRKHKWE